MASYLSNEIEYIKMLWNFALLKYALGCFESVKALKVFDLIKLSDKLNLSGEFPLLINEILRFNEYMYENST